LSANGVSVDARRRLAIATAGELAVLLEELEAARTKRDELIATLAVLERADRLRFDRNQIETKVHDRLVDWRGLLSTRHVQDGRRLLREVLAGPLRFTPEGRTYRFEGVATFGGIVAGMADVAPFLVAVHDFMPSRAAVFSNVFLDFHGMMKLAA
jgi:hypothetical protein